MGELSAFRRAARAAKAWQGMFVPQNMKPNILFFRFVYCYIKPVLIKFIPDMEDKYLDLALYKWTTQINAISLHKSVSISISLLTPNGHRSILRVDILISGITRRSGGQCSSIVHKRFGWVCKRNCQTFEWIGLPLLCQQNSLLFSPTETQPQLPRGLINIQVACYRANW